MKPDFGDKKKALCIFEYIYFARSDSFIDGVSVYEARKQAGRILARKYPVEADMVVGVPESGIDAAIGYSEESGIPYEKAIVKNSYIGRTFIKPSQKERMKSVKIKLNPIADKSKARELLLLMTALCVVQLLTELLQCSKRQAQKRYICVSVHLRLCGRVITVQTFRQEENLLPATIQSKKSQSSARLIPSDTSLLSHFVR